MHELSTVVRRTLDEGEARDALRRHLSRPQPTWPDDTASAVLLDIAPLVAPYWALRAEGTCRWTGRWARVRSDHDGGYVHDEDLEWSDASGEIPMEAEEVVAAGEVEAFRPSRESTRSKRKGKPDVEPLPVLRDAAQAWERARPDAEWRSTRHARQALDPIPDAVRREPGEVTPAWGPIDARLVLYPVWKATFAHANQVFDLWVDGVDGAIHGSVPPDPVKVEARAEAARVEVARQEAAEKRNATLAMVVLVIAGAAGWFWLAD